MLPDETFEHIAMYRPTHMIGLELGISVASAALRNEATGAATGFRSDVIATAKGLGAGYAPIGAVLCREEVYRAFAEGSRAFELGHTWDGAPLPCAVGLAVINYLRDRELVERVRAEGPKLRLALETALAGAADPRDGRSFLPPEVDLARRIDVEALARGLVVYSTQPTRDGYAGDQTLIAPAFTSSDEELSLIVERMADTIRAVEEEVLLELGSPAPAGRAR